MAICPRRIYSFSVKYYLSKTGRKIEDYEVKKIFYFDSVMDTYDFSKTVPNGVEAVVEYNFIKNFFGRDLVRQSGILMIRKQV
ncbi:MAG: hypothetical protein ABIF88_04125 [archaeon]